MVHNGKGQDHPILWGKVMQDVSADGWLNHSWQ
jgi:hypothetical protein